MLTIAFSFWGPFSISQRAFYYSGRFTLVKAPPDDDAIPYNNNCYDAIVIGAGPAGLTAALFAARAGLAVLVFGSDSGQLSEASALENFPSFFGGGRNNNGQTWLTITKQQAADAQVHFAQAGLLVQKIRKDKHTFLLDLDGSSFPKSGLNVQSRAVIVASGAKSRKLDLPFEEQLWGTSVHSCAICDGSSYLNRTVVVVGGGDAAVDAALLLSRHAANVVVLHRRDDFRSSSQHNLQSMRYSRNIKVITPYTVERYETVTIEASNSERMHETKMVMTGVLVRNQNTDATETIQCDGVFIMIGSTPNTEFLKGVVSLDKEGLIVVKQKGDGKTSSSVEGIFAAGEATDNQYKQAITAAAAGAQAAIDAERWLRQGTKSTQSSPRHPPALPDNIPLQRIDRSTFLPQLVGGSINHDNPHRFEESCDLTKTECLKSLLHEYPVVVFKDSDVLQTFASEGISEALDLLVVDIADNERAIAIRSALEAISGRHLLPNIFVGGKSLGGYEETIGIQKAGKLRELILKVKEGSNQNQNTSFDDCDLVQKDCILAVVKDHPVVVFSKTWCPYCKKAIELFNIHSVDSEPYLHVIDLVLLGTAGANIQDTLEELTGRRTVPNIFIGGNSIGGWDQTSILNEKGVLRDLLQTASAYEPVEKSQK